MSFNTVDLTNMIRGEGEWKNMQEVVRRTLKICFEQLERQGEQVAHLSGQVASLKTQLASKANRDEIGSMNSGRVQASSSAVTAPSKEHATKAELDRLKERVVNLQSDIERKASVRYVDECLQRKVDKSDMLVKNLATFSAAQYASQLKQLYQDVTDTKASVESLSRATADMQRDLQCAQDLPVMKSQMEAIYRSMGDYYTKNHIQALLQQKQDVSGLDAALLGKADNSALQAHNARIEAALEAHERAITALRLKLNDSSLFEARETLARNSANPLFCSTAGPCKSRRCVRKRSTKGGKKAQSKATHSDGNASSGYDSSASTGSCVCNNAEVGGGAVSHSHSTAVNTAANSHSSSSRRGRADTPDMNSVLRDGRVQALIEGLWIKVDNAEIASQRMKQELEGYRSTMSRIETTLSQVAGAAQMETLGLVVEEQRRRIDSILTGSMPIESITEEFMRQQADIYEIQAFLSLPQHKSLREQLSEAGELMSVLSDRIAELSTALGRAGLRIEAVETINRQLETRVQMAENGREKVQHLHNVMDLSGTEYATLKDVAKRLSALCAVILGADGATSTAMATMSAKHPPVTTRVQKLESEAGQSELQLRQLEARLRELKQIVSAVGFSNTAFGSSSRDGDGYFGSRSSGGAGSGGVGGGAGRFSPQTRQTFATTYPAPTSPSRRGPAAHVRDTGRVGGVPAMVIGGHSPASPLRSPSPIPSPSRSPSRASSPRRVTFPESHGDPLADERGLNDSRVSVDYEQALEQMLASINQGADEAVPVQDAPRRMGGGGPVSMAATLSSAGTYGGGSVVGGGAVGGKSAVTRTASLRKVDERLQELRMEKERLQRKLMNRVETL